MSAPDEALLIVLREWIAKAENDLVAAAHLVAMGKDAPTDAVCFHSQQCVEKYLKALLVLQGVPVPKTHNIRMLRRLLPRTRRPKMDRSLADRMTKYPTVARYPGGGTEIPIGE